MRILEGLSNRTLGRCVISTIVVSLIALCSIAAAQTPSAFLGGPTLGFVQDDNGTTIWPLFGIPFASVVGPKMELAFEIAQTAVSPKQDYALAIRTVDRQPILVRLDSMNPTAVPLDGVAANASLIRISPTGTAAAFYGSESRKLQLLSGLPLSPAMAYEFDASVLPGEVTAVAVSDDAGFAVLTIANGDGQKLWVAPAGGSVWPVDARRPSLAVFLADRHDIVVADDAAHDVFLLQDIDRSPARLSLAAFDTEMPFAAVAPSSDGKKIFVALRGSDSITVLNVDGATPSFLSCGCDVQGLFPLRSPAQFRLNGLSAGPMTVLDATSQELRIFLIPPNQNQSGLIGDGREPQ